MTPLTPAAVMDEQRLQEIMGYSYETDWVRDCIEALIAEVRRLQQQSQEMAHELTQTARASQHFEQQVTALIAERDDARAALQAVEWADMERRCPWCLAYADDNIGHKAYCQRQAALGVGTGEG